MKVSLLLPILIFLIVSISHSQDKDYEFNRLNTRIQTLKGQSVSDIYLVLYSNIDQAINPEYIKLKNELDKLIADSISKQADYNKELDRFNDISIIKSKILAFKNSINSFTNKVAFLKEAQILATKHNISELLYSDNDINKEKRAGFLVLTFKPEDLNRHLDKVLLKLDSKTTTPINPVFVSTVALREKMSNTKKTAFIANSKDTENLMIQSSMVSPEELDGDFELVNSYFVLNMPTNGFVKNQLVSKNTVFGTGIAINKLYSSKEKMLIVNKKTNEMYLVDDSFLVNFSVKS